MSSFLHRLGRFAFTYRWTVIGAWALILTVIVGVLIAVPPKVSSEFRIDGTPSQDVLDTLSENFPDAAGSQAFITFAARDGDHVDDPANASAIANIVKEISENEYVAQRELEGLDALAQLPPEQAVAIVSEQLGGLTPLVAEGAILPNVLVSDNREVALFTFQLTEQVDSVPDADLEAIRQSGEGAADAPGSTLRGYPSSTLVPLIPNLAGPAELVGILVAGLVLTLTLGSLLAAGLPLITALVGVGVGVGGAFTLSSVIDLSAVTPVLALMVGLAVGIDYSLFIVNRQRRLILDSKLKAGDAAARATGTAGSAVFFAGLTVLVALCGLSVVGIQLLTTMALVAAATVAVAIAIALTLVPALLGLVGERIVSARARAKSSGAADENHPVAHPYVSTIVRFRLPTVLIVIAILGAMAIPATSLTLGLPSSATANDGTAARESYDLTAAGFGEGFSGQLVLAATSESGSEIDDEAIAELSAQLRALSNVDKVLPGGMNEDRTTAILSVVPDSGPASTDTADLVYQIRSMDNEFSAQYGLDVGVTGQTAVTLDISAAMADALPLYLGVIVILSLFIMLLVFRSILIPIQATAGFLFSVLATLGVLTLVFQEGWFSSVLGFDTPGPVVSFLPILVTGILYGLAMDYQVFLVSSMRESHVHGHVGEEAIKRGFEHASKVVVAAAIIMVAVFGGFAFNEDIMVKQIGVALSVGILLDAFLIRMALTPALLALFGERSWWIPRWLDRILPNLDIEGDKLNKQLSLKSNPAGSGRKFL
ncbi:MAG: MMPL family transporter [Afipia sp.]|nr:MMPL family transporter [Afipia sp.]